MLFFNVLILFWGCTRTCSHARWFKNRIHFSHYYNNSLPNLTTRLVLDLMKARLPKNETCCDWLAVPVRCDWLAVPVRCDWLAVPVRCDWLAVPVRCDWLAVPVRCDWLAVPVRCDWGTA